MIIEKRHTILSALTAFFGVIPMVGKSASFCRISSKTITARACSKSVVPKRFYGMSLLKKDANYIWVLGKNNFDSLGACR
jgi:hypothetical protein